MVDAVLLNELAQHKSSACLRPPGTNCCIGVLYGLYFSSLVLPLNLLNPGHIAQLYRRHRIPSLKSLKKRQQSLWVVIHKNTQHSKVLKHNVEWIVERHIILFKKDTNQSSSYFNLFKLNGSQVEVEGSKISKLCRMHTLRTTVQKLFSNFQKWKQRIREKEWRESRGKRRQGWGGWKHGEGKRLSKEEKEDVR